MSTTRPINFNPFIHDTIISYFIYLMIIKFNEKSIDLVDYFSIN